MGTKRHLAPYIDAAVAPLIKRGEVFTDAFSGIGTVAERLVDRRSVVLNDQLHFLACINKARFTLPKVRTTTRTAQYARIADLYSDALATFTELEGEALRRERLALAGDDCAPLAHLFAKARHVGNDSAVQERAMLAATAEGVHSYRLASWYFGAAYFGVKQALQLDALRYAIDHLGDERMLAQWLVTAATICNAPGHTAQPLRPTAASYRRIAATMRRDVWTVFQACRAKIEPIGSAEWRETNEVRSDDAATLCRSDVYGGLVYADPPYTKDQYSRFYHVLETLYRYDYPDAIGRGRYRSDRAISVFSKKSSAPTAIASLARLAGEASTSFALSYPSTNIAGLTQEEILSLLRTHFPNVKHLTMGLEYSTMGARHSHRGTKPAVELLYLASHRRIRS